jgi:hypothetical protein
VAARHAARAVIVLVWIAAGCGGASRGPCDPDPPPGKLGTVCGFQNPEDVEVVPSAGVLLVSEMRHPGAPEGGALAVISIDAQGDMMGEPRRLWPTDEAPRQRELVGDPACTKPPAAEEFAPHGIVHGRGEGQDVPRVAAVVHGARERVDLFDLAGNGDGARLTWRGCAFLPEGTAGNDVALGPDGEIFVTNYQPTMKGLAALYYMVKGGLGWRTGDVMTWRRDRGWGRIPGTEAPNPNGIAVSADGRAILYAETGSGRIVRVPRPGANTNERQASVSIRGNPDNLSWNSQSTLLVATHTDGAAFLLCALGRLPCRTGWSLFEIDPGTLRATELLHHEGDALGAVASAAEIAGRYYLGAVFDDRIGVWRPATPTTPF